MDTLQKIIFLMSEKECDNKKLASALGLDRQVVTDWKAGRSKSYRKYIYQIADYFGVAVDYLLGDESAQPHKALKIPVLGRVAAGIPIEAITDIEDYEEIPEDMAALGEYAALRIHGDSMEPRMCDGDVVIVRIQPDVNSGDTAIVLVNGSDATCKKIKKTPEGVMLIPGNPAYEPTFYTNKQIAELPVTIFGKVVELRAKY